MIRTANRATHFVPNTGNINSNLFFGRGMAKISSGCQQTGIYPDIFYWAGGNLVL